MAKQIDIGDPLGTNTPDLNNIDAVDEALYGKVEIGKKGKQDRIRNIEIVTISPDPEQPRRIVPTIVRQQSDGTPYNIITTWLSLITDERQERFDRAIAEGRLTDHDRPKDEFPWHVYLFNGETERAWEEDSGIPAEAHAVIVEFGALESSFIKLLNLAVSIHRDGLSNAITVAKIDREHHVIETGERRWLAYHLLDMFFDDHDYSKIPARLVEEVSIWRQAAENNARDNLNAVGRARQLAILLMDLYGHENFAPLDSFVHEQDFYAQVSDGHQYPVPRGKGEQVVNAMGLKNKVQIRQYRDILRLDNDDWDFADDTDMTERQIRDRNKSDTVTAVTPQKEKDNKFTKVMDKLDRELSEKNWHRLSTEERRERYDALENLLARLDTWGID